MLEYLSIEWRHLDVEGETCLRCSETGKTVQMVIEDLIRELEPKGVRISFLETKLPESQVAQSNLILFNDMALEDLVPEMKISDNYCESCSCLTGKETYCRTIEYKGKVYEEVPEEVIRQAAFKAIGF